MSLPISLPKTDIDPELDWVLLREHLEQERAKDNFVPAYKKNVLVKLGLGATAVSLGYILLNMNSTKKVLKGGTWRIAFQLFTISAYAIGYYQYTKSPEYEEQNK